MYKKIFFLFLFLFQSNAFALIEVDITRGNLNPLPVAVSPLSIDEVSKKEFEKILKKENIGSEISSIVEKNLKTSGLFNPLNKDAFLQGGGARPSRRQCRGRRKDDDASRRRSPQGAQLCDRDGGDRASRRQ